MIREGWVIGLLTLMFILACVLQFRSGRGIHRTPSRRYCLLGLRLLLCAGLLVLFFDPSGSEQVKVMTKDELVVLVDESPSMQATGTLESVRKSIEELDPSAGDSLSVQTFNGFPNQALQSVLEGDVESVGGVLLFSDCIGQNGRVPLQEARRLGQYSVPVFPVRQERPVLRDAGFVWMAAPKSLKGKEDLVITGQVKLENMEGLLVPLVVKVGGSVMEERTLQAKSALHFEDLVIVVPEAEGEVTLELESSRSDVVRENDRWKGQVVREGKVEQYLVVGSMHDQEREALEAFSAASEAILFAYQKEFGPEVFEQLSSGDFVGVILFASQISEKGWQAMQQLVHGGLNLVYISNRVPRQSLSRDALLPVTFGDLIEEPFELDLRRGALRFAGKTSKMRWRLGSGVAQPDAEILIGVDGESARQRLKQQPDPRDALQVLAKGSSSASPEALAFQRWEGKGKVVQVMSGELWRGAAIAGGLFYREVWQTLLTRERERQVVAEWGEWIRLTQQPSEIEFLASASFGRVIDSAEISQIVRFVEESSVLQEETRRYSIWDRWIVFIGLVLIASLEWYLRKAESLN